MEDELVASIRKSKILTNHRLKISTSVPSLPPLPPTLKTPPPTHLPKPKSQLQQEARIKELSLLKLSLQKHQCPIMQPLKALLKQEEREVSWTASIQKQLDNMMRSTVSNQGMVEEQPIDQDKAQFMDRCQQIREVHALIDRQQNMRYKNKILSVIATMRTKQSLLLLFQSLGQAHPNFCTPHSNYNTPHPNYNTLYTRFQKEFLAGDGHFRKNLRSLSLQSGYMIEHYRQNRYRYLNEDIQRIKCQIKGDGQVISSRLKQIESPAIRSGIFRSLKSIDLGCLANRGMYKELTQRFSKRQF